MLYFKKNQTNNFSVSVNQSATLPTPYYLFSFRHIISNEIVNFVPKVIDETTRYIEFQFIEAGNENLSLRPPIVTFPYEGQYYYQIYEQSSSGNTDINNACLLEEGRAYVEWVNSDDETAVYYVQWQSDNEANDNWIFISDIENPPTPTPSASPTTPTPTPTPTTTPTATCPASDDLYVISTGFIDGGNIDLELWDASGYTQSAPCDLTVSIEFLLSGGSSQTLDFLIPEGVGFINYDYSSDLPSVPSGLTMTNVTSCSCYNIYTTNRYDAYLCADGSPTGKYWIWPDNYNKYMLFTSGSQCSYLERRYDLNYNFIFSSVGQYTILNSCGDCPAPSPSPTQTPTITPSITPTTTETPTPTPTPTTTLTPTPSQTPAPLYDALLTEGGIDISAEDDDIIVIE